MHKLHWVTTDAELKQLCAQWQQEPFIALDTEFVRVDTFYPIAGLIQLATPQQAYLLDPLTLQDWEPFAELLANPEVVKVVHACGEDLEVFLRLTGRLPAPLYDTQLAAAYADLGFSMGYSRLVQHFLSIDVPKEETRSDWLQRPLTPQQEAYAGLDVIYLVQLYPLLDALLTEQKREWLLGDGAQLVWAQQQPLVCTEVWRSIKNAWLLNAQQAGVLRQLASWREQRARDRDTPRNWIVREPSLLALAQQQPSTLRELQAIEGLSPKAVERIGPALLQCIEQAQAEPESDWPEPLPEPLGAEVSKVLKRLRKVGQQFAETHQMAPELVLKKKVLLDALATGYPKGPYQLPDSLQGWRRASVGESLLEALSKETL